MSELTRAELQTSDSLLKVDEVAKLLSIAPRTVWKYSAVVEGFPKPRKILGSTRWRKSEVDRFVRDMGR